MTNPTLDLMDRQSNFISDVLHELKRWKNIRNKKITITMKSILPYFKK